MNDGLGSSAHVVKRYVVSAVSRTVKRRRTNLVLIFSCAADQSPPRAQNISYFRAGRDNL
ncbi:hypothetical protein DIPPA_17783 [Diplonema papillatum]|nr:hypothetical protein DIPPA_17783 [Diplonema papillatum]